MDYGWKFLTYLETNIREHLSELEVKKIFLREKGTDNNGKD